MATIEDLQPKSFTVTIRDVEITCKPLRLSHLLKIAKIGEVFKDAKSSTSEQISEAERDIDGIIDELMPELKGIQLGMQDVLDVIAQMMESVQPTDNKFLKDKGVEFASDPKEVTEVG